MGNREHASAAFYKITSNFPIVQPVLAKKMSHSENKSFNTDDTLLFGLSKRGRLKVGRITDGRKAR